LPAVELLYVRVRDRGEPHSVRWIPLPLWLAKLAIDVLKRRRPGEPLFPAAVASLTAILRRLRAEFPHAAQVKPSSLRTTYQAIARRSYCSKEVVRGTFRQTEGEKGWRWHPAQRDLVILAVEWGTFTSGVAGLLVDKLDRVPRRAPKGCGPRDPEMRQPRQRRPDPMPLGVGEVPPRRSPTRNPRSKKKPRKLVKKDDDKSE
jgi:hypothetical protein